MASQHIGLETRQISDWNSFHAVFADAMGFPDFYGRNLNAWIDCMTCLDDPGAGMSRHNVSPGELFHLEIADTRDFRNRLPEIYLALLDCAAFVNYRRVEKGEAPVLSLILL